MCEEELSEFLSLPTSPEESSTENYTWNRRTTLLFLELYKQYRKQVGTQRVKNLKKMYEEIAKELKHKIKINITPFNCENRWKHLERMYKKIIDNNKKTGRPRKDFEYMNEMEEILGKKRNINPIILLGSDTIDAMPEPNDNVPEPLADLSEKEFNNNNEGCKIDNKKQIPPTPKRSFKTPCRNKQVRGDILREIRNDRKEFYKKYLEIEEKKLQEKIKKNQILEEKNKLLKEYMEKQLILPYC